MHKNSIKNKNHIRYSSLTDEFQATVNSLSHDGQEVAIVNDKTHYLNKNKLI